MEIIYGYRISDECNSTEMVFGKISNGNFFSDLEINVCYKNNFEMLEKLLIFQN